MWGIEKIDRKPKGPWPKALQCTAMTLQGVDLGSDEVMEGERV